MDMQPGDVVKLKVNAKRYHGGHALVLREEVRGHERRRTGLVVRRTDGPLVGQELWVCRNEVRPT